MSTVAQDVQQIREAIYGRDVREAIADGIEHCYSDVSGGVTTANTAAAAADAAAQRAITAAEGAEGIPGTASLEDVNNFKSALSNYVDSDHKREQELISYDFQYIDQTKITNGYIWALSDGKLTLSKSANYKAVSAKNIPSGTYYVSSFATWQSYVENIITGQIQSFHDVGLTTSNARGSVAINYPHNVYISASSSSTELIWATDNSAGAVYGARNVAYHTDNTLTKANEIADAKVTGDKLFQSFGYSASALNQANDMRKCQSRRWQFVSHDSADWNTGYWDTDLSIHEEPLYKCIAIKGIPSGTYWINHYSCWQTYIQKMSDGSFVSMGALGYTSSNANTSITIGYDFNIYISIRTASAANIRPDLQNFINFNPNELPAGFDFNNTGIGFGAFDDVHIIHCGANQKYKTLISAIDAAEQYMDSIVYVDAGTYDLITEFGSTYFENFTGDGNYEDGAWGIVLKNRVHLIFAENAKVVCNYTGNNSKVGTYFSGFNAGRYGFTLENANISTQGIRYAVHDDRGNASEEGYTNQYKHCRIKHNKVGTQITGMSQAIGGGLGNNGNILIEDCYFEAVGYNQPVTYHNSANGGTGYRAHIVCKGNYVMGGFRFNDTGASTEVSDVYCFNNSISYGTEHGKTTPDAKNNVAVYEWNNVMR